MQEQELAAAVAPVGYGFSAVAGETGHWVMWGPETIHLFYSDGAYSAVNQDKDWVRFWRSFRAAANFLFRYAKGEISDPVENQPEEPVPEESEPDLLDQEFDFSLE